MKKLICLILFLSVHLILFSQKKWESLKVGSNGVKFKVENSMIAINQIGNSKKDTTSRKTTYELMRKIVDSEENSLFAEVEFIFSDDQPLNGSEYSIDKDLLSEKVYLKLNGFGGNPQIWDTGITESIFGDSGYPNLSTPSEMAFIQLPQKKLKKGLKWKIEYPNPKVKDADPVVMEYKVVGKIDTLGHKCAVVKSSKDLLDALKSDPNFSEKLKSSEKFKGQMDLTIKLYIDRQSGLVVFGQAKTFMSMSMKVQGNQIFSQVTQGGNYVLIEEGIPGTIKTVNKLSLQERIDEKLEDERTLPAVNYDFDEKFETILQMKFHEKDIQKYFANGYSSVKMGDKWMLIDSMGSIIEPKFHSNSIIHSFKKYFAYENGSEAKIYLRNGKEISIPKYEGLSLLKPDVFKIITKEFKIGVFNTAGEYLIPLNYYQILLRTNDCVAIAYLNGTAVGTFYDTNISLPEGYELFYPEKSNLVLGKKDSLEYLFDCAGNLLFNKPVDRVKTPSENHIVVQFHGDETYSAYEIVNGKPILKFEGFSNFNFDDDEPFFSFEKEDKLGVLDRSFNLVLKPNDYESLDCFEAGCWIKSSEGDYSILNLEKKVIPIVNVSTSTYTKSNFVLYDKDGNKAFLNQNGKSFFKEDGEFEYDKTSFDDIFVKKRSYSSGGDEQYLVSAIDGILTSKPYYNILHFDDFGDFIKILDENRKYGLIHKSGTEIIAPQFDEIDSDQYLDGLELFVVKNGDKVGLIDINGELIIPVEFEKIRLDQHGFVWVKMKKKVGLLKYKE